MSSVTTPNERPLCCNRHIAVSDRTVWGSNYKELNALNASQKPGQEKLRGGRQDRVQETRV